MIIILTYTALQGAFELGPLLFPKPATTLTNRLLYCILRLARPVFFFFFSCLSTCGDSFQSHYKKLLWVFIHTPWMHFKVTWNGLESNLLYAGWWEQCSVMGKHDVIALVFLWMHITKKLPQGTTMYLLLHVYSHLGNLLKKYFVKF